MTKTKYLTLMVVAGITAALLSGCSSAFTAAAIDKGASVIETLATKQCNTPNLIRAGEQMAIYAATKSKREDGNGVIVQFYCPEDEGYTDKVAEIETRQELKKCFSNDVSATIYCAQQVLEIYGVKTDRFEVEDGYLKIPLPGTNQPGG